jgi:hypothetical protein
MELPTLTETSSSSSNQLILRNDIIYVVKFHYSYPQYMNNITSIIKSKMLL